MTRISSATILFATLFCGVASGQEGRRSAIAARAQTTAHRQWRTRGRVIFRTNAADLRRQAIADACDGSDHRDHVWGRLDIAGTITAAVRCERYRTPRLQLGFGPRDRGCHRPKRRVGNTVFVGGAYGGVWKSVNAGTLSPNADALVWTPLTDGQATLAIGAIAVQPQPANPDPTTSIVLAGTGETNSSADSYYGLGILRTIDGGKSWMLISQDISGSRSFAGPGFSQITFSTANPNLAVAGAGSASEGIVENLENPVAVNRGIYYSTDAGATWRLASVTDQNGAVKSASVTSVAYNAAAKMFYAAIRFHGFYWSPDGINWTRVSAQRGAGLTATACPAQAAQVSACPIYRGQIAIVPNRAGPSGAGEMYVWYVDANDVDRSIWKSLDGGTTWVQINDSGITNCGDLFGGCDTENASDNFTLTAVPNSPPNLASGPTDIYAGAANIFKCTITNAFPPCNGAGKNTFMNLSHVYGCSDIARVHPGQHSMDFLVSNGAALLYFGNDGGIYRALFRQTWVFRSP